MMKNVNLSENKAKENREKRKSFARVSNKRLGETIMQNCGEVAFIVEYVNSHDITVQFKTTGELVKTRYNVFVEGLVKSHFTPTVFGVGITGLEPTRNENVMILMGTLPKIEKRTGATMKYTSYVKRLMMEFITDITSEYKRIYEIGSRYPDVSLTIVQEAFSHALFDNRTEVEVRDFRKAITSSKNIYPDVITKSMPEFDRKFAEQIELENQSTVYERLDDDFVE